MLKKESSYRLNHLLPIFLIGLMTHSFAVQAESREDYKCFVDTNFRQGILHFSWYPSKANQYQRTLVGTKMPPQRHTNGMALYIKKVHECVKNSEQFVSSEARMLEEPLIGQG